MLDTPEFQALRREYMEGALERCGHLQAEAARLRKGEPADLSVLRQEIHKLRGSGGFYGFQELSAASAVAEDQLILTLDGEIDRNDEALATLVERVVESARSAARQIGL